MYALRTYVLATGRSQLWRKIASKWQHIFKTTQSSNILDFRFVFKKNIEKSFKISLENETCYKRQSIKDS